VWAARETTAFSRAANAPRAKKAVKKGFLPPLRFRIARSRDGRILEGFDQIDALKLHIEDSLNILII
jgi:hypothetical protein